MVDNNIYQGRVSYKNDPNGILGDVPSITISEYKQILFDIVNMIQNGEEVGNILILGTECIGKRTVAKDFVNDYNTGKNNKDKIDLISDSFAGYKEYYCKKVKLPEEVIVRYSPYWFPSYRPTGDFTKDSVLDSKANGKLYENGGIILFNDFFTPIESDKFIQQLKQHLSNLKNRCMDGYKLGSKWAIVACSPRPCDNTANEVYKSLHAEIKECFTKIYHLTPDPDEWRKWVEEQGLDEPLILDYIFEPYSEIDGEWPRWISVCPDGPTCVTPLGWTRVLKNLVVLLESHGLKHGDLLKLPIDEINLIVRASLRGRVAEAFINWLDKQRH